MESGQRQNLSPTKSPDEAERPESPLTGLEFDMARLSLEAQNEGLREKVHELQTELMDGKSHEQYLRREQVVEAKQIREEERKRAQAMVSEVRRKLYKEKQQEVHELRERLHREKEKEIAYIIKQKDEELRKAQLNWNREKDDLVQKLRVQFTNEIREEAQKSHEKQIRKFEVYIEELKDQKKKVEESCKLAQDADKKKVDQIRRMHSEHEQELAKLKRSSWQEGRKQMAEIRQLTNIIHQLEKKLGVESGHYIRLQLEKDSLRDKLDRIKGNEMSGRKSPLSASRTDLSSDLSMFPFPSVDDSNPLWLKIKQQKCTIAQLKQSIQDKNRRIDLLKQKLFKNRRFGGAMHRSMDDILSYESGTERDDCISPMFGYSTGSSDTSSLNEESFKSDDSQDAEIIRRLQKEILQLQKTHSLLQAQSESNVDVKRTQLEKEQLQTDLIEAQRQIDELNKDLVESHDRNELLEFQLQESLQRNVDEGNCISTFKIPTLCVEYQFSDEELFCSTEEVKARLEELQNEKKPVLTRDEQLTLRQAKRLLENISTVKEHGPRTFSFNEDHTMSGAAQKDFLQLPMFDDSLHSDGSLEETDYCITTTTDSEGVFLERSTVEPDLECDLDRQKPLGNDSHNSVLRESVQLCDAAVQTDFCGSPGESGLSQQKFLDLEMDSHKSVLKESVQLYDVEVQTDFHEIPGEFGLRSDALEPDNDLSAEKVNAAVQCSTYSPVTETSSQCNILEIKSFNGDMIVKFDDDGSDICKFKKVMDSKDIGIQFVPEEVSCTSNKERRLPEEETSHYSKERSKDSRGYNGVDSAVQCNIIEILTHEEEIFEIFNEFKTLRFKKVPESNENAVQTDMQEYDVIDNDVMVDDVIGNNVVVNDAMIDDVMGDDMICADVMVADVIANVPEVQEDGVQEKHDGEPSEKSLLGLGWKDFVDGSELGDDVKCLDCIVYEKEDVFIVICESYRKYCKEISCNDYTFDDDNVTDEPLETCSEEQIKHNSNGINCDNTVPVKLDNKMAGESDYSEGAGKNFQTLNLDSSNKNVSKATEQIPVSSKTVMERNIEKCEIGIQYENQKDEYTTSVGEKCPHCMKPLSISPGNGTYITNNTCENPSFSGGVDSSMLYSQFNEDEHVTGIGGDNELDLIEEFRPEGIDFTFREMCDFAVQCDLHDGINLSPSDVQCLRCGQSKTSCSDIAIQCEFGDILSSDLHDGFDSSSSDVQCLRCGQSKTSCSDIAIQCEFRDILSSDLLDGLDSSSSDVPCLSCGHSKTSCSDIAIQCVFADLLSSSNGMHSEISEIPGILQEGDGESLIKEVMALAKECSKNDALIDQHWSEVVLEQGLFSQIQDGEDDDDDDDGDDEDGDQGEISLSDEQSRDLYSEIPNSQVFPENEQTILRDFGANSEEYPNDDVISEEEMPNFPWKEVRDVETQCGENESLEKEEKAIQCTLLNDEQHSSIETIPADEDLAGDKVGLTSRQDYTIVQGEGDITEKQGEPRSGANRILPQGSGSETLIIPEHSNGGESRVIAENTLSQPTLNIDLNNVFNEMEAQSSNPILPVTLTPQESTSPAVSDESTNLSRQHDDMSRSLAEESTITRTSKSDTLDALDETLQAFAAEDTGDEVCDDDYTDRVSRQIENSAYVSGGILETGRTKYSYHVDSSQQFGVSVSEIKRTTKQSNNEYNFEHGESSATSSSVEGAEMLTFENDGHGSEETSSSDTSSQVTVENTRQHDTRMKPVSPHPFQENPPDFQANIPPTHDKRPPITDTSSFPYPDIPPPLPNTLPPTLPFVSPPSVMHSDLDDDIDALLAGELDQDTGDLTPSEDENPVGVRPTLEHEIQTILESEDSSVRSEPNTVLSMDSLYMNQTATVSNTEPGANLTVNNSACYENTDVFNDETEMMSSFDDDDVISDDVSCINDNDVILEANDDVIFETNDRLLYASVEGFTLDANPKSDRKSRLSTDASQKIVATKSSPVEHVVFESEISEDSTTESSSVGEVVHRRHPPPVLPKPKYRSHSMNLPISELPPVPTQSERPNSMAAQKDIVDGCFPPVGLVPRRASEFNLGECDLLKERIMYLERQLKNKENLLQSMRAEATEIETNAYIQKKEEDIKMMDESVRFLKVENQKKEKELIVKIGELNKCTFELEQLRSERSNAERQREILEDNVNSLQDRVSQLQSVQVQYQELRCKCDSLVKENTQLHEQVSRLHRADEEFVELEKTISKLQGKLKELEDVKRERDDVSEQLKALKTQKDDLAHKGRKVETERNDFLMNNKLMQQQKENLEARNNALQRTNDTFKTKISSLEKECRDSQRKLFDIQRERDEGSSQLRKLEAERNELRKRVNELIECKSELKQYQSKSQDVERELNFLRTQCKKIESERTELSTELGNCLKERNRLVGRTAQLEKLTRDNEKLEEKFHTLKLKIAELTGQRDDAEVQLPTLKAKVALLKKACKEKDDQLDKLKAEIRELKHSIASFAVDDLSSIPTFGFGSPEKSVKFREPPDLNNNHATSEDSAKGKRFVVLFDYDPERLSTTGHPEKELKLNEGDVITVSSELDLNGYYMAELDGKKGLVSSLYIEEIDEYDMRKLRKQRQLNASKSPAKKPDLHSIPPRPLANMPGLVKRSFVALNDYNPFTSSTSTRPDLELPLTAGELVTVVGDVDANGYYTVEKGGRLAIVPSNLVKPSSPSLTRPNKLNFAAPVQTTEQVLSMRSQDGTQGTSTMNTFNAHYPSHSSVVPRQPTVIHAAPPGSTPYASKVVTEQFIRQSSVENVRNTQNISTAGGSRGSLGRAMNISSALPSAPRNLRVLRCVNKDALLLGWITPEVDELGRNNGQLVKGYKILANGQSKLHVDSPYMAKALIENLDLTRPVELAIQTVSDNGFCSEKSITHFNEAVMMETTSVTTEDISHLDNNSLPYRTFVALFSYDPLKSSPNPNPTLELEFQEGDIIRVLDNSRPDGYYTGQVNGHEGLVPSNFIEEIAVATRPQHRKRDQEMNDSNASLRSTSSLSPKKAKAMVALYDYNPTTQSPNRQPDRELSFRKGQIVRVLGSMRSDGFYEADINGQRGLVPATFLKPCKRKSTKSVNSTNGFASLPRRVQFAHEQDSRQMTAGYV